jgi:hypothetical protein
VRAISCAVNAVALAAPPSANSGSFSAASRTQERAVGARGSSGVRPSGQ